MQLHESDMYVDTSDVFENRPENKFAVVKIFKY